MYLKLTVFLLCLICSQSIIASNSSSKLRKESIQKLSYSRLQMLRNEYIKFTSYAESKLYKLEVVDREVIRPNQNEFYHFFKHLNSYYSAFASGDDICFFGGWASRMSGHFCEAPW